MILWPLNAPNDGNNGQVADAGAPAQLKELRDEHDRRAKLKRPQI